MGLTEAHDNTLLNVFQSSLLVWLPALSQYRSSQLHQQCLIGHCFSLGLFFFKFSALLLSPFITLQYNTPLPFMLKSRISFDKIYFILSILLDYYQNTNGNLAPLLLLLYNWILDCLVLCGWGLFFTPIQADWTLKASRLKEQNLWSAPCHFTFLALY